MENKLMEGMNAPNFKLEGSDRKVHSLNDYIGKKVILYFYPKDNTPGCSTQAESFKNNINTFNNLNIVVLGISRDSLESHDKFINKLNLPFILLSDSDAAVCALYGVLKEKTMFGKKSIGIERSTFIINEDGFIEKIYRKVKAKDHINEIISYFTSVNL